MLLSLTGAEKPQFMAMWTFVRQYLCLDPGVCACACVCVCECACVRACELASSQSVTLTDSVACHHNQKLSLLVFSPTNVWPVFVQFPPRTTKAGPAHLLHLKILLLYDRLIPTTHPVGSCSSGNNGGLASCEMRTYW